MRLKIIVYYFFEFILSILMFTMAFLLTIKFTVGSEGFIKKVLVENSYYDDLYDEVKEELSGYAIQSGFSEDVLENSISKELIEGNINSILDSIFDNKDIVIDTEELELNLAVNIESYLIENNLKITDHESLTKFSEQIIDAYREKIGMADGFNTIKSVYNKAVPYLNMAIIINIVAIFSCVILIRIFINKNTFAIPLLTSGIISFIAINFVNSNIDISNILIFGELFSNIVKELIYSLLNGLMIVAIIMIIIGLLFVTLVGIVTATWKSKKA